MAPEQHGSTPDPASSPVSPAPAPDIAPAAPTGTGTADGNPVAGVVADPADLEDAVSGDTGPEHPRTPA